MSCLPVAVQCCETQEVVAVVGHLVQNAGTHIESVPSISFVWSGEYTTTLDMGSFIYSVASISFTYEGSKDLGLYSETFIGDTFPIDSVSGGNITDNHPNIVLYGGNITTNYCTIWAAIPIAN